MRWTTSKQMALCGVLAALAVSTMVLGGLFPAATYFCPVLACLMLVPVTQTCGRRIAWAWYGAVAILSCLLCPDVEASAVFVFLGYYPIVKGRLDRIRLRPLRWLSKLAVFVVGCGLMYAVLIFLLSMEEIVAAVQQEAPWVLATGLGLGVLTFFLTDLLLTRLETIYRRKLGGKEKK